MVNQQFTEFLFYYIKAPRRQLDDLMSPLLLLLLLVLLCLPFSSAQAALSATVDRTSLSINDTLTLTIRSSVEQIDDAIDLNPLRKNFTIINSSRSSKISYINGKRSSSYDLVLSIAPNQTGNVIIPSFNFKGEQTAPINLMVSSAPTTTPGSLSEVFLDNRVDKQEAYVQEQIIYTLKIYHSVGLTDANLSPLEISNAVVKQLGDQKQYESILNGVRYAVIEINYAVFPQSSGRLEIPLQTLTARSTDRRNGFSRRYGKMMRVQSPTQIIDVLPKPANYPANSPWLPTAKLDVQDSWADGPPALTVGESVTRSVRLRATGLSSAQLPDIKTNIDSVKNYPDKPKLNDEISFAGITGEKIQATAYVPQTEGSMRSPAITIYWWNTSTDQLESTLIPAIQIEVAAAKNITSSSPVITIPETSLRGRESSTGASIQENQHNWLWPGLAALFALFWLLTLAGWWQSSKRSNRPEILEPGRRTEDNISLTDSYKRLQKACNDNDPQAAHAYLLLWFKCQLGDVSIGNLADIRALDIQPDLAAEMDKLEAALYSTKQNNVSWQGQALLDIVNSVKANHTNKNNKPESSALPRLYPL